MKKGFFVCGSRVMLEEDGTISLPHYVNLLRIKWLRKIIAANRPKFSVKHVRGCNFAFWKADFISINGYNEDIVGWGQEDSELGLRLIFNGVKETRLKFGGVVRHLYHKRVPLIPSNKFHNHSIRKDTKDKQSIWCENGIDKYLDK